MEGEQVALTVATFLNKITSIRARMFRILYRKDFQEASEQYASLADEIDRAEADFEVSMMAVSDELDPLDVYWLQIYRTAIVQVFHTKRLFLNFLSHGPSCPIPLRQLETLGEICLQRSHDAAQEILDCTNSIQDSSSFRQDKSPRALFEAIKLVWPLTCVMINTSTTERQKFDAYTRLVFIGNELGVRQALIKYEGGNVSRLPPEARTPRTLSDSGSDGWQ